MSENMHTVALHICGTIISLEWDLCADPARGFARAPVRHVVELALGLDRAGIQCPWTIPEQAVAWARFAKVGGWRPRVDANLVARVAIDYIEAGLYHLPVERPAAHQGDYDILLALSAFSLECSPVYGRRIIDALEAWLDETDNPGPYRPTMKSAMAAAGTAFDAFGLAWAA